MSTGIKNKKRRETVLVLDGIRSNFNVGSIFRIADCAGISKIILCGVTPAPTDRFGRVNKEIAKVALGAEKNIPWENVSSVSLALKKLKVGGFRIVSLEQAEGSKDYKKYKPKFPLAVVLGNEVTGVSKKALSLSDDIIEIPMKGEKESLNVAIAAGVALFRILNI